VEPGRDSLQPRVITLGPQHRLTPPHGWIGNRHVARKDDILQGINSGSGPPWESVGPLYIQTGPPGKVQDLHGRKLDPRDGFRTPLCGVQATHSRVPGFWDKEYPGLNQGQAGVRSRHVSRPYRIRFCSPPRRSPDAATWHGARDVSQRAEPDVRPRDCATSAFIADKARRLSIPLAGNVLPQHLLSPVHSTDRRCAASAFNETCPFRWQAATSPFRRRHACPFHWQTVRPYCCVHYAHHHSRVIKETATAYQYYMDCGNRGAHEIAHALVTPIIYSFCYVLGTTCRGSASLYVPPLSYKREGTRRYKADPTQTLKLTDSIQHIDSGVGYYAPAA
jgi:hypothetical protein